MLQGQIKQNKKTFNDNMSPWIIRITMNIFICLVVIADVAMLALYSTSESVFILAFHVCADVMGFIHVLDEILHIEWLRHVRSVALILMIVIGAFAATQVILVSPHYPIRPLQWLVYVCAACFILVCISATIWIFFSCIYNRLRNCFDAFYLKSCAERKETQVISQTFVNDICSNGNNNNV